MVLISWFKVSNGVRLPFNVTFSGKALYKTKPQKLNNTWGRVKNVKILSKYKIIVVVVPYSAHGSSTTNEFSLIFIPPANISKNKTTPNRRQQCSKCFDVEFIVGRKFSFQYCLIPLIVPIIGPWFVAESAKTTNDINKSNVWAINQNWAEETG